MTVIIFIIVLAILIFVHELGHFLLARWNGIRVDAFKIGFGPRILSWKKGETEYGINLIPFGGFVRIHGENPDDESIYGSDKGRSFSNKNRWRQASVLVAGVAFNFLFAFLIYIVVFNTGVTATKEGFEKYASFFTNHRIMLTNVSPESPADVAGLKVGDVIRGIQNAHGTIASDIESIQNTIYASQGQALKFMLIDGTSDKIVDVVPKEGILEGKYAVGIAMQNVGDLKLPFFASIYEGAHYTVIIIRDTIVGLSTFIYNIFRGTANFSDVAGPVGIAGIVGNAAELGFTYLLMITALISINLGVINLIPFPALDGGRTLFVAIEGIIRRRIPMKFFNAVNLVGFVLLMVLMVVVTYKDILKLI